MTVGPMNVDPEYLERLAQAQDDSSGNARGAATATNEITAWLWVTHGVMSFNTNLYIEIAEKQRRGACENIAAASSDLGARLRAAKKTYTNHDGDLAENFDTQLRDK